MYLMLHWIHFNYVKINGCSLSVAFLSCQKKRKNSEFFFFFLYLWQSMVFNSTHTFIKAHATVPITVFSCLSDLVEQFEVSHQAQLVWWQDLLEWNCCDAEQAPQYFLVKRNVNQTHVAQRQGRNETSLIQTAASLWYHSQHFVAKWSPCSQSAGDVE